MADTTLVSTASASMVDYPLWLQATGGDAALSYSGLDDRALIGAVYPGEGIITPTSFKVVQRAAGANFSVDIAAGTGIVIGDSVTNQGSFLPQSTATVNLGTMTAPVSGTRVHKLVVEILDKQSAGTAYGWQFRLIEDTGSGLPATPASALYIASVTIAAAQASVTDSNIVNTAPVADRWLGGLYSSGPIATLYQTSSQGGITPSTWTDILVAQAAGGEVTDPLDGHSTSVNQARYVAKVSGTYRSAGGVTFTTSDANLSFGTQSCGARLAKNGTALSGTTNFVRNQNIGGLWTSVPARARHVWLDRGDYITLQGWHDWPSGNFSTAISGTDIASYLDLCWVGG